MSHYDQIDDGEQKFPKDITKALGNKKLTGHKDAEIRTIVACCLADLMRIYAPHTPYEDGGDTIKVRTTALSRPLALSRTHAHAQPLKAHNPRAVPRCASAPLSLRRSSSSS